MKKILTLLFFLTGLMSLQAETRVPAFPGAEGFGRYVTGGRGGKVLHVTSLADDGSKGTFRWACEQSGARIIVFDVYGTIHLKSALRLKNPNVTIAGQTAPGDGICIADYPFEIRSKNTIIRYVRFRLGNVYVANHEGDGLGAMDTDDIMVDHCSISWSIDECCSVYGGKNITVQWSIVSQSLRDAGHEKGTHGYGGNWGGSGCTYAHNLLCHHESRTPRLGPRPGTQTDERLDMRNNVIYNWAGNGCYGGEGMNVNIVNNYYKPGPATNKKNATIQQRIASPGIRTSEYTHHDTSSPNQWDVMWHVWGDYYVDGNVNSKYSQVTGDNWTYGIYNQIDNSKVDYTFTQATKDTLRVTEPLHFPYTTTFSANDTYGKVLDYAGCVKIRSAKVVRDHLDSIMVSDTRNGVATFGNSNNLPGILKDQDDCVGKYIGEDGTKQDPWPELTATSSEISRQTTYIKGQPDIPADYIDLYFGGEEVATHGHDASADYDNIEYYLNMLVQDLVTKPCTTGGEVLGDEVQKYKAGESAIPIAEKDVPWNVSAVFDLKGARHHTALSTLPEGLYVVGGKKVLKK